MNLNETLKIFHFFNFKTLYFNLKYFSFKQAIKFPVFITRGTALLNITKGKIILHTDKIKPGMIRIGDMRVGLYSKKAHKFIWEVEGEVHFYGGVLFKYGSKVIVAKNGILRIGDKFRITTNSSIICYKEITFGTNVIVSWDSIIMDTDFHKILDLNDNIINYPKEITIGNNVWIGMKAVILKGTKVEDWNIIASNSLLSKPIEGSFQIIAGNPAKVVKKDVKWHE